MKIHHFYWVYTKRYTSFRLTVYWAVFRVALILEIQQRTIAGYWLSEVSIFIQTELWIVHWMFQDSATNNIYISKTSVDFACARLPVTSILASLLLMHMQSHRNIHLGSSIEVESEQKLWNGAFSTRQLRVRIWHIWRLEFSCQELFGWSSPQ